MDDRNWQEASRGVRLPNSHGGENGAGADSGKRFIVSFAEVSAFVVVFSGLIYLMGLFVYVFPIARTYTHNFAGAWYAASLVPKAVVAGQGAYMWWGFPMYGAVLLLLFIIGGEFLAFDILLTSAARRWRSSLLKPGEPGRLLAYLWHYLWTYRMRILIVTYFLVVGLVGGVFVSTRYFSARIDTAVIVGATLTIINFVLFERVLIPSEARAKIWDNVRSSTVVRSWRRYLVYLTLIFIGSLCFSAGVIAQSGPPPLPSVEITRKVPTDGDAGTDVIKGALLAHTEGFWYVFNQNDELMAIPDSKVTVVQIAAPQKQKGP